MFHRFRLLAAILSIAVLVLPSLAQAQYDQPREHDGGIFIRLSAGMSGATAETTLDTGEKFELEEYGGNHNFTIGGIVGGNTALHATLFGWAVKDPTYKVDGVEQQAFNGTLSMSCVGGGATWYWMPRNFYVSGNIGFAWLSGSDDNIELDTGVGGAFDLTIGKEWWTSDRWGIGVALALQGYSISSDRNEDLTGGAVALRFSATFN